VNEEFEKWFIAEYGEEPKGSSAAWNLTRVVCLRAWQASRKQALEEAAATCDEVAAKGTVFVAGLFAAQACRERIRSLQKE
jgi:hypothetical protein